MKLYARSKNKKKTSEIIGITKDGWVVTKDGAFGDNGRDCEIVLDMSEKIKEFRKEHNISQLELSWVLAKSRPTIMAMEKGKVDITLKDFLTMKLLLSENYFDELSKDILKT